MSTELRLIMAAETRIRVGGYNGFSFRDIARDTGLTNAGVHHHFPTKASLVARVAEAYTVRFLDALEAVPPLERPARLAKLFSESLRADGRMCLCGILAAESGGLPETVVRAARNFFDAVVGRLAEASGGGVADRGRALAFLAQLEGAALLARAYDDVSVFDQATRNLRDLPGQ